MNTSQEQLKEAFIRQAKKFQDEQIRKQKMIKARNRFSGALIAAAIGGICKYIFDYLSYLFYDFFC